MPLCSELSWKTTLIFEKSEKNHVYSRLFMIFFHNRNRYNMTNRMVYESYYLNYVIMSNSINSIKIEHVITLELWRVLGRILLGPLVLFCCTWGTI